MKDIIENEIRNEAKLKAIDYQLYQNYLHLSHERNKRRLIEAPVKNVKIPEEWMIDDKHNPFHVLKKIKQISRSISKKLLSGKYQPNEPFKKVIPKKNGGTRNINVYQIPDSAVSDKFYHNLLAKNKHRFSSLAYAYRNDRNIHFAIQDIANEISSTHRIFVAEFDFSDFFGSIGHQYILDQLDQNSFLISDLERQVIKAFLPKDGKGIPLGTSISLFLANLACWRLDRRLENEGLRFARYADDTIIWSKDYGKISKAFDIISEFSKETGILINFSKSDGISLLQQQNGQSEFNNTKTFIEFLGYKISCDNISIKEQSVIKIKNQISYLLYKNLIQPLKSNPFNAKIIPDKGEDHDLVTAIMQIRRYLYGEVSERKLGNYLNGAHKTLKFKGIMSFYPLIDDEKQMKELDSWMISTILIAISLRGKLLSNHYGKKFNNFPFETEKDEFLTICKNRRIKNKRGLMQIPSFLRIHKAIRKGILNEGIEKIMHPKSIEYYEE
ncbi:reverse transcriptase domain-containing protein [Sphingobacterium zeae]|uniref:reverse transcriptase domain-containing protein n=1 Tax=Sphingobacterium zeae TaxID=1776859 RepID=UPI00361FE026